MEIIHIEFTEKSLKHYKKLSSLIKKKADKQFHILLKDQHHGSLRIKKMNKMVFEGRIDYHYRFTFFIQNNIVYILTIGPHDEGLGKK